MLEQGLLAETGESEGTAGGIAAFCGCRRIIVPPHQIGAYQWPDHARVQCSRRHAGRLSAERPGRPFARSSIPLPKTSPRWPAHASEGLLTGAMLRDVSLTLFSIEHTRWHPSRSGSAPHRLSGISMPNASSKAMTNSTVSRLSAPRSSISDAAGTSRGRINAQMATDDLHNLGRNIMPHSQPPRLERSGIAARCSLCQKSVVAQHWSARQRSQCVGRRRYIADPGADCRGSLGQPCRPRPARPVIAPRIVALECRRVDPEFRPPSSLGGDRIGYIGKHVRFGCRSSHIRQIRSANSPTRRQSVLDRVGRLVFADEWIPHLDDEVVGRILISWRVIFSEGRFSLRLFTASSP